VERALLLSTPEARSSAASHHLSFSYWLNPALTQTEQTFRLNRFYSPHPAGLYQHHMDQTLHQLGELLLGSVPTVILLALLYALYTAIVHKPLRRVLEERRSKTEGAVEKSRADIAASEARTSEYEQRLREARAAMFKAQEARRQTALQARTNAVNDARNQAQAQVQAAKKAIENDRAAAEKSLQGEAAALAQEIIRRVLQPAAGR
jgi:F-type H+-transporting ATPase subunit b